jgi:hypothetical protein
MHRTHGLRRLVRVETVDSVAKHASRRIVCRAPFVLYSLHTRSEEHSYASATLAARHLHRADAVRALQKTTYTRQRISRRQRFVVGVIVVAGAGIPLGAAARLPESLPVRPANKQTRLQLPASTARAASPSTPAARVSRLLLRRSLTINGFSFNARAHCLLRASSRSGMHCPAGLAIPRARLARAIACASTRLPLPSSPRMQGTVIHINALVY